MTLKTLVPALTAVAVVLAGCSSSEPAVLPPRIVFQHTTHDFGRAAQGTKVTHTYAFHNAGGLGLTVDNLRASCNCTVVALSGRVIPPGGEGSIEATLDTTRDSGRKTRTITVYSNDPAQPVTTLTLVGNVDADVAADPPALYIGHVRRGQPARNEVRLLPSENPVISAESRSKVIDPSLHSVAGGTRLQVVIKPDAPSGRFKDAVTIHTRSPRQPTLTIAVAGVVDVDAPSVERRE